MNSSTERDKKRQWSYQENILLKQLYPNFSSKKWKKISQIFKQRGYYRTQLEIRERWTNFQDPNLLFTQWTDQQLQTLYKSYTKFGSKWCFIKRTIPGRTENKIKNKFYGNIRIFLRFVVNYFNNTKQDTMWIHKINPSILNDIYKGTQQFSQFGNEMQVAIQDMGYNVDKIKLLSRIQSQQVKYKFFYDKVIELYKTMEQKKQHVPKKVKKQSTQLASENDQQSSQQKLVKSQIKHPKKRKAQKNEPKHQISYVPYIPNQPMSMMYSNNYDQYANSMNSMMYPRQQQFDSNFPLLHMQNSYQQSNPYPTNYWFYQN